MLALVPGWLRLQVSFYRRLATCRNGPTGTATAAGLDTATSLATVAGLATTVGLATCCRFGFGRRLMDLRVGMLGNAKVRLIVWTGARGYKDHQDRMSELGWPTVVFDWSAMTKSEVKEARGKCLDFEDLV
ncbi:hypothetical protein F2Q69_00002236 [Brassica cretica]|uniref:Uncharacterized protein n=1 Tax=Brassica cretica TaxID=69181 RepID=A0A8S9NZY1_BRACR|nr:hypothetical protein F2Q69_00002236 [Brassica cretica]